MFGLVYAPAPVELDSRKMVVTYADMENGKPGDPGNCAIAVALQQRYPGASVNADRTLRVYRYGGGWKNRINISQDATVRQMLFMTLYDITRGRIRYVWRRLTITLPEQKEPQPVRLSRGNY